MSKRVYNTAVRNLVRLTDEEFERAVEEARTKRAAPPEEEPKAPPKSERRPRKPRPTPYQAALAALCRLSEPEFERIQPEAKEVRSAITAEHVATGRVGCAFTFGLPRDTDLFVHVATQEGHGFELAVESLANLSDADFERAWPEARARRLSDEEWKVVGAA
jgi:hypothetical protein